MFRCISPNLRRQLSQDHHRRRRVHVVQQRKPQPVAGEGDFLAESELCVSKPLSVRLTRCCESVARRRQRRRKLQPHRRRRGDARNGEGDRTPVAMHCAEEAEVVGGARAAVEELSHGNKVLQRLTHLPPFDVQVPRVHPAAAPLLAAPAVWGRAAPLRDFVLVVREGQVDPARVQVQRVAEGGLCHCAAFDVPPRSSAAPGRVPAGLRIGLGGLPESKVSLVSLQLAGVFVDYRVSRRRRRRSAAALCKRAVQVAQRPDVEPDVFAALCGRRDVAVAALQNVLDEGDDVGHVLRDSKHETGLQAP
mmetsp:Transcript_1770/g.5275  ORF Transcript_1770/g.5275 Transcript_1770/m.5275 type:complete len:306 (-) Transcript_1770:485-1402(-)